MLGWLRAISPFERCVVEGDSMSPALSAGERVVVNKLAYWRSPPQPGDLVVLRDPRRLERLLLKRIERPAGRGSFVVAGDNASASTDSRQFGPVPRRLILGKVWSRS